MFEMYSITTSGYSQMITKQKHFNNESFLFFFNCCLTVAWPTLCHYQAENLTNPMLIIIFVKFWPEGHQEPYKYITLIFSSNTSFAKNCGSALLICEKCYHNTSYGNLNFNVPLPPSNYRDLWDYKHSNIKSIQLVISMFD